MDELDMHTGHEGFGLDIRFTRFGLETLTLLLTQLTEELGRSQMPLPLDKRR